MKISIISEILNKYKISINNKANQAIQTTAEEPPTSLNKFAYYQL